MDLTFIRKPLRQEIDEIDLDGIEMNPEQREYYRQSFQKAKETFAELDRVSECTAKLQVQKEKSAKEVDKLEKVLPELLLSFGFGKKKYSQVLEHKTKIAESKSFISDIESTIPLLKKSVSQAPIRHAQTAMDQIRNLQEKQAEKKAKEAKR